MFLLRKTRAIIEQGIGAGHHPGAQLCVIREGERLADFALGTTSFDENASPLTSDHLTLWLSAGKPILAVGLARLVEAGTLTFDDPVAEWVPEFAQRGKDDITLRHVLTHTGGFRSVVFRYPEQTWDESVAAVCAGRLEAGWEIGTTAGYHPHSGWNILGKVLEVVTGQPLGEHLRSAVLEPLGMDQTWVGMPDAVYDRVRDRLSAMTNTAGQAPRPTDMHARAWITGQRPGGNTYGPASQLAEFYNQLMQPDRIYEKLNLSPAMLESLTQRHRRDTTDRTFRAVMDWGLGLMVNNRRHDEANAAVHGPIGTPYNFGPHASDAAFGHGGNQSSIGFADPHHRLALAVVFNGMPGEPQHQKRMAEVLDALYRDLGIAAA